MSLINARLLRLVQLALSLPPESSERREHLSEIYVIVMRSGKLWRGYSFQRKYYADALQEMWEYSFSHLDSYQPEVNEVTTWLNDNLKRVLQKYAARYRRESARRAYSLKTESGTINPVDNLSAPPDTQPSLDMLNQLLIWVKTDTDGQLRRRKCKRYAHINAQTLILRRLPPNVLSWEHIAKELNADKTYLAQWYARHCYKLLRRWGHSQGYLLNIETAIEEN